MEPSFVTAPKLVKARLLRSNCKLLDPSVESKQIRFQLKNEISIGPYPEEGIEGFIIFAETTVAGKDRDTEKDEEYLNIDCEFGATFVLNDMPFNVEEYESIAEVYTNQLYPIIRQHLLDTLNKMDINGTGLPYSLSSQLASDEPEEGEDA